MQEDQSRSGSCSAAELYTAVGVALSFWEACEDNLLWIYRALCEDRPETIQKYIRSPRHKRAVLFRDLLKSHLETLEQLEMVELESTLSILNMLAITRNAIAHGHCADYGESGGPEAIAPGYYWLPAFGETGWFERSFRFVHTAQTINAFTTSVIEQRKKILDIYYALLMRRANSAGNQ